MIDIKFVRENPEAVRAGLAAKRVTVDVDRLLAVDAERRAKITDFEQLRAKQNRESEAVAKERDAAARQEKIVALKAVKDDLKALEPEIGSLTAEYDTLMRSIPNLPRPDVRVGRDDSENYTIRTFGEPPRFDFEARDYMTLGESLDIIDVERAGKTSGSRFGFLKGDGARLEFALVQYALEKLIGDGFTPIVPPVMINERSMSAMGYMDRGRDEIYRVEGEDLYLVGTSEQVMGAMHIDETFQENELPRRYVGFSTCFRKEAGSYGKDVRGILRVHQFDKLEMFSYTVPEGSDAEHERILATEEGLMQGLNLPYRVLGIVSGDLGDPAARKFDIETWVPSQNTYRETHSCSTCTDWQARRLNVRVRRNNGEMQFCHTLNGTAFAVGRTIIAILENYQRADGSVAIPEVLRPYMGGKTAITKR
ncbi:serine--tRNA ligase [Candidatus Uhrbacteria bacterium]|nr:serine--tRNA ligase [Candidatus Uhrbacteria bacterium]